MTGPYPSGRGLASAAFSSLLVALSACAGQKPTARQEAMLLVDKGQHGRASALLEQHLAKQPRDVAARRLAIRVYALQGQLGQSQRHVEALFTLLGRASAVPFIELGHALELAHRYDEALEQYDRAAEAAPRDPLGPLTGGMRAARWGEAELAEPRLVEALKRDPRSAQAWHALGIVRLSLGNRRGAKSAYVSGLVADPTALENRLGLATVALSEGDASAALAQYDVILAMRPRFADAQLGRAWALMKLGRLDEAEQALDIGYRLGANRAAVAKQRSALRALRRARR